MALVESIIIQHSIKKKQQPRSRQKSELSIRDFYDIPEFLPTTTLTTSRKVLIFPAFWFFIILIVISSIKFTVQLKVHLLICTQAKWQGEWGQNFTNLFGEGERAICLCIHVCFLIVYLFISIKLTCFDPI